ncbi:asparagine synthase (glutamine-hydrolyzing) [Gangjinia marincola]|uniref:asparagine synthase (glutamine-hydrolyzing) n=1 Tax=Gangjinia marincola TaxID=578463 RepID=A0ABP3XSC2_9FLAO
MCGIIGHYSSKTKIDASVFNRMRDTMTHRGPDGCGTEVFEDSHLAFGHRRLSIIDLSEKGHQPMSNEDQTVWLTFNGEIYNFQKLKKALETSHTFSSDSDSEVLIHGYEEWGFQELLQKLKGMFSFALYDQKKHQIFAARDRFGIKPFHYYKDQDHFVFSSEIKGITSAPFISKEIDTDALADYFTYSYVPHPNTIWKGIKKLKPAHYLIFDLVSNEIEQMQYWELKVNNEVLDEDIAIEQTDVLLRQAVKEHMVSDVPVGLFLSGGYDSSSVLMHMKDEAQEVNTFSLGFKNSSNSEHIQARAIAEHFGVQNHLEMLGEEENFIAFIDNLLEYYDEPYATSSMIPYFHISRLAAKNGKVALAGDGGDEVFAGYRWHYEIDEFEKSRSWKYRLKRVIKGDRQKILIEKYYAAMTGVFKHMMQHKVINENLLTKMKNRKFWYYDQFYSAKLDAVKQFQWLDTKTFMLESCLVRADQSSMAHSLEVRVPFLDHELFEFTFNLKPSVYLKKGIKKFLLFKNLEKRIPKEVLDMPKRGFSWQHLTKLETNFYSDLVNQGQLVKHGIITKKVDFKKMGGRLAFHLLILERWFNKHNPL